MTPQLPVWSKAKLAHKLSVIAFVPFLLTSICIMAALAVLFDSYAEARAHQRARQIAQDCESTIDSLIMCGTLMSMYMRSRDPEIMQEFNNNVKTVMECADNLKENAADQPAPLPQLVDELQDHTRTLHELVDSTLAKVVARPKSFNIVSMMGFRSQVMDVVGREKQLLDAIEATANAQLNDAPPQHSPVYLFLKNNLALAIGMSVLASISLALLLARRIVERLKTLTGKAARLALLEAPGSPETGSDEIAQVDHVFNDMAFQLLNAIKREQAAIACAADAILSIAADGRINAANAALTASGGWQPQDLIGQYIYEFVPEQARGSLRRVLSGTARSSLECPLRTRTGGVIDASWSTSWSPGQQSTIAIIHDVTERKRAEDLVMANEARTRMLMERMPAGLILLSDNGEIRFANATAAQLAGTSKEALNGVPLPSLLVGSSFESAQAFVEVMSQRAQAYVTSLQRGDGQETKIQLGVSRFGKQGGQELYLAIMLDYTERWQFEELKQRLIAMIAHDIATPLMTVQNTLTMAGSGMFGELKENLQADVQSAEHNSSEILQVFKNVVRFQKLAAGFSSMSAAQLRLTDLTREALDVVTSQAQEKNLKLENLLRSDEAALGDSDKLAVLGATLLQTVVDSCTDNCSIQINGSKEAGYVHWRLLVNGAQTVSERAGAYLTDIDVFENAGVGDTHDLDLILWRLLLYQCGAKVSYSQTQGGYIVDLKLPCLQLQPTPAALS